MTRFNVTILGDSRSFDTYFTNDQYSERYGYDKTFPSRWRRSVLSNDTVPYDVIHIPDHFRAGTIENNVIRLALTDPGLVVLCDGLWDTLLNGNHFLEYATRKIRDHELRSGKTLTIEYSSDRLIDLFLAGELSTSPQRYSEKVKTIASYFLRRRRRVVWMNLAVPASDHLEGRHYAGDYRCLPRWAECLRAINGTVSDILLPLGGTVFDVDALMGKYGGPGRALIDQWHFSPGFHAAVAKELERFVEVLDCALPEDHVSRRFLVGPLLQDEPVALCGDPAPRGHWKSDNPRANVVVEYQRIDQRPAKSPRVTVLLASGVTRTATAAFLLKSLPEDSIVLFPEELGPIVNPSNRGI